MKDDLKIRVVEEIIVTDTITTYKRWLGKLMRFITVKILPPYDSSPLDK